MLLTQTSICKVNNVLFVVYVGFDDLPPRSYLQKPNIDKLSTTAPPCVTDITRSSLRLSTILSSPDVACSQSPFPKYHISHLNQNYEQFSVINDIISEDFHVTHIRNSAFQGYEIQLLSYFYCYMLNHIYLLLYCYGRIKKLWQMIVISYSPSYFWY